MKYAYLLTLLLSACSRPDWITYPVDHYLTVQLPALPKVMNLDSLGVNKLLKQKTMASFKAFAAEDENGAYLVVVDSSARVSRISAAANRDSLYKQGISQILGRNKSNRLLSQTHFHTPAGEGVELVLSVNSPKTSTPVLVYNRTLLAHRKTYTLTFTPYTELDSAGHTIQRRRFFNSITVKP
jgi:hypothetical protein